MLAYDTGWKYHVLTSSENYKCAIWTKICNIGMYTHTHIHNTCQIDTALDLVSIVFPTMTWFINIVLYQILFLDNFLNAHGFDFQ